MGTDPYTALSGWKADYIGSRNPVSGGNSNPKGVIGTKLANEIS